MALVNRRRKKKERKQKSRKCSAKSNCRMDLVGIYGNRDIQVYACIEHPNGIGCGKVQNYDGNLLEFSEYITARGKTFTPNKNGQKILNSLYLKQKNEQELNSEAA
jgi:hypothetical protein